MNFKKKLDIIFENVTNENLDTKLFMTAYLWPGIFEGFDSNTEEYFNPDHLWVDELPDRPDDKWITALYKTYKCAFEDIKIISKEIEYHKGVKGNFEGLKDEFLRDKRGTNPLCCFKFIASVNFRNFMKMMLECSTKNDILDQFKKGFIKILKSNVVTNDDIIKNLI